MNKKLRLVLLGALVSAVGIASAQSVNLILPASANGLTFQVQQLILPELEKRLPVETIIAGNCIKGHNLFEKTTRPAVMIAYNGFVSTSECPLTIDPNNFYVSLFSGPVAVCANPRVSNPVDAIVSQKSVTVGLGGNDWPQPVITDLNPNFKSVVYGSSGALLKGFAAGDTDFIITNLARASTLVDGGHAVCVATTSSSEVNGIPPAATVFPKWNYNNNLVQAWVVVAKNLTKHQEAGLRKSIKAAMGSDAMQALLTRGGLNPRNDISIDEFVDSSIVWTIR